MIKTRWQFYFCLYHKKIFLYTFESGYIILSINTVILKFQLALTHKRLLQDWRDRALQGQQEARRVMAEMLTPAGQ
jgi:hypothetical protein